MTNRPEDEPEAHSDTPDLCDDTGIQMGHLEADRPHHETEAHARHRDEPTPNGRLALQGSLDLHPITENAGEAAEESGGCRPSDGLERVILQEKFVPRGSSMIIYRATNRIVDIIDHTLREAVQRRRTLTSYDRQVSVMHHAAPSLNLNRARTVTM